MRSTTWLSDLEGRHQIENAAVAFALMCELAGMGFRLDERAMSTGLSSARWPGRLERIEWSGADVILDAAHNPAGAMVLAAHLRQDRMERDHGRRRRHA